MIVWTNGSYEHIMFVNRISGQIESETYLTGSEVLGKIKIVEDEKTEMLIFTFKHSPAFSRRYSVLGAELPYDNRATVKLRRNLWQSFKFPLLLGCCTPCTDDTEDTETTQKTDTPQHQLPYLTIIPHKIGSVSSRISHIVE
jgi:hypothetical protein